MATQRSGTTAWSGFGLGPDPSGAGHHGICERVNSFPAQVYTWGNIPTEGPHWDLAGGVRPVLYYILRREYLSATGIGVCRNTQCRELFEIERAGQEFCGDVCSRHQRQREYWTKRGRKLRKHRLKITKGSVPVSRSQKKRKLSHEHL